MEKTVVREVATAHEPSNWAPARRAGVFYLLAYAISWLSWMGLIVFFQSGREPGILWKVGQFGPFLAAIAAALIYGGPAGLWRWLKAAFKWRIGVLWYLMGGLILPVGMASLHIALYLLSGGQVQWQSESAWYLAILGFPILVLINAPFGSGLGEELGWQGFAMPRLVKRVHPLLACTVHGVLWAAWHLPAFWAAWMGDQPLGWFFAYVIPLSMIAFWLTRKAKGSVIPAVLLHTSGNLYGSLFMSEQIFTHPLAANFTEIKTVLYWAIAIVLIVATKGRLGYKASAPGSRVPIAEGTAVV